MLVKTFGCALFGIDAITVTIEVNIDRGINFYLVGLPDNAVKESQQRIEAAITNLGYRPMTCPSPSASWRLRNK